MNVHDILCAAYAAIETTNEALPRRSKLRKDEDKRTLGEDAKISGFGLTTPESAIESELLR
jgi:hypothetical protein